MKLYKLLKLFKPHIVEFENGLFAIRKLTLFGFCYKSTMNNYWWCAKDKVLAFCTDPSYPHAYHRISEFRKQNGSLKVKCVYNG